MKEINCPKCNQHIKILGTDYDLYKENLLKKDNEIKRLKEDYMILQNASDEVEEEKDKEIERLKREKDIVIKLNHFVSDEIKRILKEDDLSHIEKLQEIAKVVGVDKEC